MQILLQLLLNFVFGLTFTALIRHVVLIGSEIAPVAPRFTRERTVASVQCRDRRKGKRHCRQSVYCVRCGTAHAVFMWAIG